MNKIVTLFAYMRKKEIPLTWIISSIQKYLINSNSCLQLVHLGESLLSGTVHSLLVPLLSKNEFSISVQFTCNLSMNTLILTNVYGPSQAERKLILLSGSPILICLIIWIG
jgi:hypothetical protein